MVELSMLSHNHKRWTQYVFLYAKCFGKPLNERGFARPQLSLKRQHNRTISFFSSLEERLCNQCAQSLCFQGRVGIYRIFRKKLIDF